MEAIFLILKSHDYVTPGSASDGGMAAANDSKLPLRSDPLNEKIPDRYPALQLKDAAVGKLSTACSPVYTTSAGGT